LTILPVNVTDAVGGIDLMLETGIGKTRHFDRYRLRHEYCTTGNAGASKVSAKKIIVKRRCFELILVRQTLNNVFCVPYPTGQTFYSNSVHLMEKRSSTFIILTVLIGAMALVCVGVAGSKLNPSRIDIALITLVGVSIAVGTFLKAHIERYDLQIVIGNATVLAVLYLYGGEIGVIAATIHFSAVAMISTGRSNSVAITGRVVSASIGIAASTAAAQAVGSMFGSVDLVAQRSDMTSFVWFVSVATVAMYVTSALLNFAVVQFGHTSDSRWSFEKYLLDSLLIFGLVGIAGGLLISGILQTNTYAVSGVIAFFAFAIYMYRRYMSNIDSTAERFRSNERARAESAEGKVESLERYVGELETMTQYLQESHENFRHAAYHDELTGLPNRNYFIDRLKLTLQESKDNTEANFAILLLDLNRFKTINDSLGHSMGDRLIRSVAKRLEQIIREQDMVARFSGDKFGIILSDLTLRDEAMAFADRLNKRVAEPYTLEGRQVFTNVKIGIAFGNSRYAEAEDILRDADIAMYYAKDNNENHVIFDQKMHIRAVTRMQLETDLRYAIERKEFELHYQPIIGLENADLVGFEALVRWNHPTRGLVPPNEFIPISEHTGLIVPMTIQILQSACNQVARWQAQNPAGPPLSVAVNLSGKHFAHPNLVDQISAVLAETRISPASLKLELTESAVMENAETAILMLKQIKKTGVQISIDDFGTGYSSLSYLHRFPIDLLKVDRSFVSAMEDNSENGEIVRTVIALAKALNLKVVAEGIESIHQFHQLRILGCEFGQGYLFSKPLPVAEIEKLLQERSRWTNILPSHSTPLFQTTPQDINQLRIA